MPALWMILASLLFACMGACVKLGTASFGTGELVFYRGLVGMLLMAVVARLQGVGLASVQWRLQLSRGLSGSLALACYFFALGSLPLATAVTLSYTSPLFVALLLPLCLREPLRPAALLAVALGFAGVVALLQPTLRAEQWQGALGGLGAGLIASVAYLNVRELGRAGEPEVRTVFWFSALSSVLGLPWAIGGELHAPDAQGFAIILGIGLFGGCAQLAMTRAYRFGKTLVAACLAYTTVLFSSLLGLWLWNERLPAQAWLAMAAIVASGVLVSLASRTPSPRRAQAQALRAD